MYHNKVMICGVNTSRLKVLTEEEKRELMKRESGEEPVLLLDDVLSELDPGRQDFVLNQIVSGQVFITCCEPGRFTKLGKTIEIEKGNVK